MSATFLDLTSATEKWIVDDVCRAAIVHKDSPSIESFYCEHYDQGVIMRLLHPSRVFFKEKDVLRLYFNEGILWMLFTCL